MSKTQEALRLALEALEVEHSAVYGTSRTARAITAIREALAEQPAQQQEPYPAEEMQDEILRLSEIISTNAFYQAGHADALEWAAQMAVLEDPRTSDWVYDDLHDLAKALRKGPDFPSPPPASKPWVGLTEEEVKHEWEIWRASIPRYVGFAKGIETKLREKNA